MRTGSLGDAQQHATPALSAVLGQFMRPCLHRRRHFATGIGFIGPKADVHFGQGIHAPEWSTLKRSAAVPQYPTTVVMNGWNGPAGADLSVPQRHSDITRPMDFYAPPPDEAELIKVMADYLA